MEYLIIPTETLKEIDTEWEFRRKSNDGTKAIIHKETWDELTHYASPMPLYPDKEVTYPLPIYSREDINQMDEFKSKEQI